MNKQLSCENLLIEFTKELQKLFEKMQHLSAVKEIQTLTKSEIQSIASCIKNFEMDITETKGFDSSKLLPAVPLLVSLSLYPLNQRR